MLVPRFTVLYVSFGFISWQNVRVRCNLYPKFVKIYWFDVLVNLGERLMQ